MSAVTRNRELSQFGSFLYIDDGTKNIGIATNGTPNIGIGTTNATSKVTIVGDINISGVVTASNFYGGFIGTATNATIADYALVSGLSTVAIGLGSVSSVNTSGIITASAFYVNDTLIINPEFATWLPEVGSTVYRLGNVGIGTSIQITEKLVVSGNVSADRFFSTVTSGTAPFVVLSDTQVTNLNASFLRGKVPPTGQIVGTTDIQTLTNKTLTSPVINGGSSGSTILQASEIASGILTLPAATDILVGRNTTDTLTNKTISASSNTITGIQNSNLTNSTISGVSLGSTLFSLSFGSGIVASGSYNGSSAITISAVSVGGTWTSTGNELVRRDINGDFAAGSITCSYLTASFDINSNSDESLKTNIKRLDNSLQKVNELRGVTFEWKETGKSSVGVIAQDVEKVLPELVKQGDVKSVNYNGLIAVLIEAIKDLSNEVGELKKKVL